MAMGPHQCRLLHCLTGHSAAPAVSGIQIGGRHLGLVGCAVPGTLHPHKHSTQVLLLLLLLLLQTLSCRASMGPGTRLLCRSTAVQACCLRLAAPLHFPP